MAMDSTNGRGLVEGWMQKLVGVDFIFALAVARQLWLRRNALIFENLFMAPLQVLHVVKSSLEAFEEANATMGTKRRLLGNGSISWKKSPLGVLKINWDATLQQKTKKLGVGVVIRDDSGAFVAALSKIVPYIVDPLTTEIVAVWHAA
ncbi:uncharacterized protein LOC133863329 [Alnus glutinosa]|uniref:uncharacterized protein LOC133863329 n=1 Tax=Alnus glutinosa TaxID=3517 RepID=UPI002D775C9E|nr:uncharacterized protein LOC133863329 [Alnus glutinosa]